MADKIVAEYTVKVDGALKNLDKLAARVDKIDKERKQTQKGFKEMSSSLSSSFAKVGSAIGVAFGTQQIVQFGKEAVTLAAQLEGVERAFKRIGGANSANLLQGLRKATRGTVSDLVLMQKAVQASNFKIPLENLASLFKFAQARARETGESVEYLTNSIVLGIGRKSPLILDNLGISAVELRTRLKGVGVEAANVGDIASIIGDIAEEELAKMGDQADTTADKIAQLNTALENTKTTIGEALIDEVSKFTDEVGETEGEISKLGKGLEDFNSVQFLTKNATSALLRPFEKLNTIIGKAAQGANVVKKGLQSFGDEAILAAYRMTLNNEELVVFNNRSETAQLILAKLGLGLQEYGDVTADAERATEKFNKALLDLKETGGEDNGVVNNIKLLNNQLKELKTSLSEAEIGGSEFFDITEDIADKTKELNEAIAQTKLQDAFILDEDDPFTAIGDGLVDMEEGTEESTTAATDAWNEHFNELMAGQDAAFNNDRANREQSFNEWQQYITQISGLANSFSRLQRALGDQELANLRNQLDQGQITREEYDVKRRELLSKQAEEEKQFAIFDATINGAVAIVNAFKDGGPILAALVAAGVAAEIAIIAARPTPKFAEGGWVDEKGKIHGRSHAYGGVKIEAEGNEYITAGKYAKPNADILEAINTGNWEKYKMENIITPAINQVLDGGFENMGASYMLNNSFNDKNMLFATDRLRKSNRMDAQYIVSQLKPKLRKRGNYA